MPVLVQRPEFIQDVLDRVEWLVHHRPEEQLDHFFVALAVVREQIARAPLQGAPLRQDERYVLRLRLFLRPLPYLVYYAHPKTEPMAEIYLVHLYGSGQDRPEADMSMWPW